MDKIVFNGKRYMQVNINTVKKGDKLYYRDEEYIAESDAKDGRFGWTVWGRVVGTEDCGWITESYPIYKQYDGQELLHQAMAKMSGNSLS